MIRRRKFLIKLKSYLSYSIIKINLITDNLYFNDKISKFSENKRFFTKKVTHLYKNYNFFRFINEFSSIYNKTRLIFFKSYKMLVFNLLQNKFIVPSLLNVNLIFFLFKFKKLVKKAIYPENNINLLIMFFCTTSIKNIRNISLFRTITI